MKISDVTSREKSKNRLLIAVAIVCGSVSAGVFYVNHHPRAPQITDDQARRIGYFSASDEEKSESAFAKYYTHIGATGRLSDEEYQLAVQTINHGSWQAQIHMIAALGYVRGNAERCRVIQLMPTSAMNPAIFGLWRSSFHRWMSGPKDESVLRLLEASGNSNAVRAAGQLRGGSSA